MLAALLQLAFQQRAVQLNGAASRLNYVLYDHNPHTQQLSITAPQDDLPSFVFLRASRKIADLNIHGGFGEAKETGLVWNQPVTRLFNVLLEMKTANEADFYLVRWAQTVVVNSCYFGVDKAIIYAKVFKALSVTDSSLVCAYIMCNGVPYSQFIKSNAFFTQNERVLNTPTTYEEPCEECPFARRGKSCSECMQSTYLDGQNCVCTYRNYAYLDYYSECHGTPALMSALLNDTVSGVQFEYFTPCEHNFAFRVNYQERWTSGHVVQFFHDDACGINNIWLNGSIVTESTKRDISEVAGFVFTKTTSMSNVTLNLTVVNSNKKLLALTAFARNATGNIVFENCVFQGNASELGLEHNMSSSFRINVLFHTLYNVSLTLRNVTMPACNVGSYWDGTYNSIGIGVATNCNISAYDFYIGDALDSFENPVLAYDFDSEDEPQGNCTDKMSMEQRQEALFRDNMPLQLLYGRKQSTVDCDSSGQAGFIGLLQNSRLVLNRSLIAVWIEHKYLPAKAGLVVMDMDASFVSIQYTSLHGNLNVSENSGAIGRVNSALNQISVRASLNMTTYAENSGFFGIVEGGLIYVQALLNVLLNKGTTGGLVGWLNGGSVSVLGAFGYVKTSSPKSNPEVGYWTNGVYNDEVCEDAECLVSDDPKSFINLPSVDGVCGAKVTSTEPVGANGSYYFAPCGNNQKIKINWAGVIAEGNLTVFNPYEWCQMVNINITGTLTVSSLSNFSYGVMTYFSGDTEHVYIDMNVTCTGEKLDYVALLYQNHYEYSISNVVIKGSLTAMESYMLTAGGCIARASQSFTMDNVALYGVVLNISSGQYAALVVGYQYWAVFYYNILIDDYSKAKTPPDFNYLGELPADFKCAENVYNENLKSSLRRSSLLQRSNPNRRSKLIVSYYVESAGGFVGYVYDTINATNVSLLLNTEMDSSDYRTHGMLFPGCFYTINLTSFYVEGVANQSYGCLIFQAGYPMYWQMAAKVAFMGKYSGIIYKLGSSGSIFELAVNLELNGAESGGLIYHVYYGDFEVSIMYGVIAKNADYCFNVIGSSKEDERENVIVSNSGTCPDWP